MELFKLLGTVAVNTSDANKNIEDTSKKSKNLASDFEETAGKAADFSAKILAATEAAVVAIGGMALSSSMSMESALDSFAASTGTATDELEEYEDVMKDLYANNYGDSFGEVADAMAKIKQQMGDIGAEELKEMTTDALLLGDTFGYDVNESVRTAKMLMDQFELSSKEAFNLIAQGAQNGLDKNGDLLDSINEYAVHYKQMGYNADQFFNSLKNGTEAGTFSVDKLGDAMKEFGIRVKDTSTTTTDAFALLGYGAGASGEEIAKTKQEIAKLEKELKYAKKEQEGFNEKTSELTRMKNADKIAEYTSELEVCRAKLADLTTESGTSLGNINDLQARFAAGGETAREATQEVLEALYAMDDKVAQNAAGVGLFGTQWEDLGIDGIKALTKVEGGITSATDALTQMADVKYDNLASEMEELKDQVEVSIIEPLGERAEPIVSNLIKKVTQKLPQIQRLSQKLGDVIEKSFKKLEPTIEWLIDDGLPVFVDILGFIIENFEVLIGTIATFYGVVKTLSIINSITTAVQGASGAFGIFNAVLSANPIGAVVTAVALLAGGLAVLISTMEDEETQLEKTKKAIEAENAEREARIQAVEDERAAIEKKAAAELQEIDNTEALWKELQTLCDESGNVKDADKARADFILGELNEALGTEYTMTGNQITQYQEMTTAINDLIDAKRAEILLNAQEQKYSDALIALQEQEAKLAQESLDLQKQEQKFKKVESEYLEDKARNEKRLIELEKEYKDALTFGTQAMRDRLATQINTLKDAMAASEDAYLSEKANLEAAQDAYEDEKAFLQTYYEDIAAYENASVMLKEGKTEEAIDLLMAMGKAYTTVGDMAGESVTSQMDAMQAQVEQAQTKVDEIEKMLNEADEANKKVYERQLESAKKYLSDCEAAYLEAGGKMSDAMAEGFEDNKVSMRSRLQIALNDGATGLKYDAFNAVGKNIAEGISAGMSNTKSVVDTAANSLVNALLGSTKKAADINSPSKLFADEVGEYIPSGVAMGVEDNQDEAIDSVNNMVGLMSNTGNNKATSTGTTATAVFDVSAVVEKLNQLIGVMTQQRIYLNGDVLVGELAPAMNTELGNLSTLTERGQ